LRARKGNMFKLSVFSLLVASCFAGGVLRDGHFGYGHISWKKGDGNSVSFRLVTMWRRSYDGNYKLYHTGASAGEYKKGTGTGSDGRPITGDRIEVNGRQWPEFNFGDDTSSYVEGVVTAYSASEDWFLLETTYDHTYASQGPWEVSFTGCCRLASLANTGPKMADQSWILKARVNLSTEQACPDAKTLPIVSVPGGQKTQFFVPATDAHNALPTKYTPNGDVVKVVNANDPYGKVEFNGVGKAKGVYSASVNAWNGNSYCPIDFLISVTSKTQPSATGGNGLAGDVNANGYKALDESKNTQAAATTEYVGFGFSFTVAGSAQGAGHNLGVTWGGVPSGVQLSVVKGVNPITQTVTWKPSKGQDGHHIFCFEAADNVASENGNAVASTQKCIDILVKNDPPTQFTSASVTGASGSKDTKKYTAISGQTLSKNVVVSDGNPRDSHKVSFGGYQSQCDAKENEGGVGAIGKANGNSYPFSWTPKWNQGAMEVKLCFTVADSNGDGDERCININVKRCKYAVNYQQQLQEIAALYQTDWITLWQHNGGAAGVQHPDQILFKGQEVNVGSLYRVSIRDNLNAIARRFGTSVAHIKALNSDICSDNKIVVDKDICIHSNSCSGMVKTIFGNPNHDGNTGGI